MKSKYWIASILSVLVGHLFGAVGVGEPRSEQPHGPQYDFLYIAGSDCLHETSVQVVEGKVRVSKRAGAKDTCDRPAQLLRYYVDSGRSAIITLRDAEKLVLDPGAISPDGFELKKLERSALTTMQKGSLTYPTQLCLLHRKSRAHFPVMISEFIFPDESAHGFSNALFIGWIQK